ncbi:integrase [Labrys miyagiensis]|uniref:Integrase n=1 Tax=Labrys miyagiensis TaxID=346912 RepID=A0ABQ6CJ64_9HYPH|nr:site-specific integrase [Labrys miyagiensis]GLS18764.1 integrase [Labrys miyagiensis]
MAREIDRLSARTVTSITKPGRHADGGNLFLVVDRSGAKRWTFIFRWNGKLKEMGLGGVNSVTLARARELAGDARRNLADGENPIEKRRAKEARSQTFAEAADDLILSMAPSWKNAKHKAQWEMTIGDTYCKSIRAMDVTQIRTEQVLEILKPIWQTKAETASRIRGRIERVLNSAKAAGFIKSPWENPARWSGHLDHILPRRAKLSRGHHAALPYEEIPAFMKDLRSREATAALALELLILTATRTSETLLAKPGEFDLERKVWTIPAERMKMKREHRVPLAPRAVEIIEKLKIAGGEWLIPGAKKGRPLSNMAMLKLLERMDSDVTVHGFRSAFKDWAAEVTPFANEVSEAALAHLVGDETERAYRRGDLFDKRRALMESWAAFCTTPPADNVIPLKRG